MITLGGKAGSGKSSVGKFLEKILGYERVSVGDMKRKLAEEMGLSIQEFNVLGDLPENVQEFDRKYEDFQQGLLSDAAIVLESRLSFWCQPDAFNVFLNVSDEIGGERIWGAGRNTDAYRNIEEMISVTTERNRADSARYLTLYGIDPRDLNNYSLVIDTGDIDAEGVARIIETAYAEWKRSHV